MLALGQICRESDISIVAEKLSHQEPLVRASFVELLGHIGHPNAITPLAISLMDKTSLVRGAAGRVLKRIDPMWMLHEAAKQAIPSANRSIHSEDSDIQHLALQLFEKIAIWDVSKRWFSLLRRARLISCARRRLPCWE